MKIDYRERILVVDDEAQNQKLLKSILSIDGYIVDLASDGPAALRLVNETPPDLILLDVVMPGMDGHEVCRQLKSEMASRNIPVIFVTGQVDIEAEMRALEAGAADYLTKPLSLPIVRARVRTQLALHRQRRSLEGMFRDVIEFAPDAFVLTDNDGRIVQINARSEELFGYHRSELIGLPVETLIPDRLRGKHEGHRKTYADESRSLRMGVGLSCLRKDGTEFPGDINLSPLNTGRGRLLMAVVRDVTESLRTQQEISDSRRRLREMAMQGEAMREHERKNIAREVHDELGQVLTALRMDLTFLDLRHGSQLPALKDKLQEMRGLVDRAIQGVRNVASNLRPTALDLGLIPAIQWLCDEFSERTGVPCNFEAGRLECELPEYHSISMFRIAQESLTNITRYAQATTVLVSLSQRDGLVLLQVRDNGLGFDTNQAGRGHSFGLLGMQERAIALGGTLEVASESGRGTAVNLTVPVPPRNHAQGLP